jgi:sterol desaturase/sphingolipid hydroxylase (fatty acid hydroxylase superfamily)
VEILGFSEGTVRFASFAGIFALMTIAEALWPRRARRETRMRRWPTNLGILLADYAAVFAVTFVVPVTAVIAAMWAQDANWGLFNLADWPGWIEALAAFVILDFVIWGQHVVFHRVPALWRVHRVHHADHDLDATSGVRFHPFEILISIMVKAAAVVAIGADPLMVVIFEAAVNGSAMFNHANLRLPAWLDRALRAVIVTPDMHRVHHSTDYRETDNNYGFLLSVWDRLFSVYTDQPRLGHDDMTIGLSAFQEKGPEQIGWSLLLPFRQTDRPQ